MWADDRKSKHQYSAYLRFPGRRSCRRACATGQKTVGVSSVIGFETWSVAADMVIMITLVNAGGADGGNDENLRAKINTLDYELKNLQQERSLLVLQHEKELRDLQLKADADFKRAQVAHVQRVMSRSRI